MNINTENDKKKTDIAQGLKSSNLNVCSCLHADTTARKSDNVNNIWFVFSTKGKKEDKVFCFFLEVWQVVPSKLSYLNRDILCIIPVPQMH